jgi:hypothetical protein
MLAICFWFSSASFAKRVDCTLGYFDLYQHVAYSIPSNQHSHHYIVCFCFLIDIYIQIIKCIKWHRINTMLTYTSGVSHW